MPGSKNNKLKKIVVKWQKMLTRSSKSYASLELASTQSTSASDLDEYEHRTSPPDDKVPQGALVVYVGKDRRRYVVGARYLDHPLFKSLMEKSAEGPLNQEEGGIRICCEVVMFEHLLWMLENDDPAELQTEVIDELLDFYKY